MILMGDTIIFEGKQYRKEDFVCYPSNEPKDPSSRMSYRMRYFSAFNELWKQKEAEKLKKTISEMTSHNAKERFSSYFLKLYASRKKENKPITWNDFKDFEL
jgi:hypothetical protein